MGILAVLPDVVTGPLSEVNEPASPKHSVPGLWCAELAGHRAAPMFQIEPARFYRGAPD